MANENVENAVGGGGKLKKINVLVVRFRSSPLQLCRHWEAPVIVCEKLTFAFIFRLPWIQSFFSNEANIMYFKNETTTKIFVHEKVHM
jgi:hypothetical protein